MKEEIGIHVGERYTASPEEEIEYDW
ncbi:hypothetical protein EYZ11_013533 [Aspergillus tanneri]|uniref:Uncharacterized protein n=1 Tax=Aspergillus tanneri TaxID=1220188 RepID=A0A4S3IXE8_9EURO|nr:hypothetical protein EYZ11_013533 [Aspergillus tanneri]